MRSKIKWIITSLLMFVMQLALAQEKNITGVVTEDSLTLPGVNVLIEGSSTSTQTDFNGNYSIKAKEGDILVFSFIGMKDAKIKVGTSSTINYEMEPETNELETVVVTAFGIKKSAKAVAYAVQEVKGTDLNKASNNSLSGALQGKLAGVQITPSSGAPGASSQINIRGARSFTGNNTPLYVIDGMPVASTADYSTGNSVTGSDVANRAVDIDPSDIESISVLKGQAAAALYGLRASNGVIVITTKSGKGLPKGKPVVTYNSSISFETISKKPTLQNQYAQGSQGIFNPYSSLSWGPKISDLPNDPTYGGNVVNSHNGGILRPGMYYVPQRQISGLDPWVKPAAADNIDDYFKTGHTINNSINLSQSTEKTNYSFGIGSASQEGFMPGTSMDRYTLKAVVDTKLNNEWSTGFSANYVQTKLNKAASGNDSPLPGVFAAPRSYDVKGNGSQSNTNPYEQVFFRGNVFNNPYWAAEHNEFSEKTNRFYGNGNIQYKPEISEDGSKKLTFKYQAGIDSYTTNYRDVYEFGHQHDLTGGSSRINLYGITTDVINSLLTVNYSMNISNDLKFDALLGNEYNHENNKRYNDQGTAFNFGGWQTIENARNVTSQETRRQYRTMGFFGNGGLSYKDMFFLNGTIRNDIVSSMPRGNRSFVYPSVSLGIVLTELEALKDKSFLSFAKLRGALAEVGQAGDYYKDYYTRPTYSGGFWSGIPVQYPLGDTSSFIPNSVLYDPNLKPQNTKSYEIGVDLKFFNNRIGLDYAFSRQNVTDQIFAVPLAGSTGATSYVTNGGKLHTIAHEVMFFANPVKTADFEWNFNINFSKVDSFVDELADGVDNITLGGFVTPQIRVSKGNRFPVIYGTSFVRDNNNSIVVDANGMPLIGEEKVLGEVMPKFVLGGSTQFNYKRISVAGTFEWKNGGKMYSGTNNLLNYYGVDSSTGDRDAPYIFQGVKQDGSQNDVVIQGSTNRARLEDRLNGISENSVYDASFVKLREVTIGYTFPKLMKKLVDLRISAFTRNILLWSKLPNIDPESSQGNNNLAGGFEQWSVPQTKSIGFSLNATF